MARRRQAIELGMTGEEIGTLTAFSRSRTEPASRVSRAAMLLAYRENPSFFAVAQKLGVHHQTVQRCVERALVYGPLAALDDRPRPGKQPTITPEAKAWLVSLACDKAREHGYPHDQIVEHVDRGDLVIEFDAVEEPRLTVKEADVSQVQITMASADLPSALSPVQQFGMMGQGGAKGFAECVDLGLGENMICGKRRLADVEHTA